MKKSMLQPNHTDSNSALRREEAVVASALWAAYGDALGFMSELTDQTGLGKRIGSKKVTECVPWRRRVGGKMGVMVDIPAGMYSDDTQLRLATCRSIGEGGRFDLETFAKIELTIWPSYALGAGRASKAAATNLARSRVTWFSNFFHGDSTNYFSAGGNGAAMRVQPHAWCHRKNVSTDQLLLSVIKNAICTHGHERGVIGAAFHALCVRFAVDEARCPSLSNARDLVGILKEVEQVLMSDQELAEYWIPTWEQLTERSLGAAFAKACMELEEGLQILSSISDLDPKSAYLAAVEKFDATSSATRGSGIMTPLLATFASFLYAEIDTETALITICNVLGTDTDSIATMAGAILGAARCDKFSRKLVDLAYIESEARRVAGESIPQGFKYPDLFRWEPPQSALDVVVSLNGRTHIKGFGDVKNESDCFKSRPTASEGWQILTTSFDQTLIAKRRSFLHRFSEWELRLDSLPELDIKVRKQRELDPDELGLKLESQPIYKSVDELTSEAIVAGFPPTMIGHHFLAIAEERNLDKLIAYAAIIGKARITRIRREG